MDAIIRFCFLVDAEKIEDMDEYAKLFSQAKYVIDYAGAVEAKKVIGALS